MPAPSRSDWAVDRSPGTHAIIRRSVLLLLLVLWTGTGRTVDAQPSVQLDTHVSADSVLIGGRFTVSFVAEHDGAVTVSFPSPGEGLGQLGDVEVRRRRVVDRQSVRGGRQVDSAAYEVTTFALDSARVPPVPLQIVAGDDTSVVSTPPRGVTVASVLKENRKGIHSVAPLASFPRPIWPWVLAVLVGATLLGGLIYYLWWHRQQPDQQPTSGASGTLTDVNQTPYEAATAWIRQLESYDLSDSAAITPFYVELSSAVRVYIANELGVAALERTTREIVNALEARADVPDEAVEQIGTVLKRADRVKFAGIHPGAEVHEQSLHQTRSALDAIETAPREPARAVDKVTGASD